MFANYLLLLLAQKISTEVFWALHQEIMLIYALDGKETDVGPAYTRRIFTTFSFPSVNLFVYATIQSQC